jgi:Flp pilus assembly protein TadD
MSSLKFLLSDLQKALRTSQEWAQTYPRDEKAHFRAAVAYGQLGNNPLAVTAHSRAARVFAAPVKSLAWRTGWKAAYSVQAGEYASRRS